MDEPALLKPGHYVSFKEKRYKALGRPDWETGEIEFEQLDTGQCVRMPIIGLFGRLGGTPHALCAPTLKALEVREARARMAQAAPQPTTASTVRDSLHTRAETVIKVVDRVESIIAAARRKAAEDNTRFYRVVALKDALDAVEEAPGQSQYYEWRRRFRKAEGKIERLAHDLQRSTNGETRITAAQAHLVDVAFARYYHTRNSGRSLRSLCKIIKSSLARTGGRWVDPKLCRDGVPDGLVNQLLDTDIPIAAIDACKEKVDLLVPTKAPGLTWVSDYLKEVEADPERGKDWVDRRCGEGTWEREHAAWDSFVVKAQFPLQYVFADWYELDVFGVDKEGRRHPYRLWLVVFFDAFSRCIVGWALSVEGPSIESIQEALRNAIWSPDPLQPYGIPQMLYLDNAWANLSISVKELARQLACDGEYTSMELDWRPRYKGRYGALVERYFGNLSLRLREHLAGAIHPGDRKRLRSAMEDACLLYEDIFEFIGDAVNEYHNTRHSEIDMTPLQRWRMGLQAGIPLVPEQTEDLDKLFWRLEPDTRQLDGRGVRLFGLHYINPEKLGEVPLIGGKRSVQIRFQMSDVSRIAVYCDDALVGLARAKERLRADGTTAPISMAGLRLWKMNRVHPPATESILANAVKWQKRNKQRKAEQIEVQRAQLREERAACAEAQPGSSRIDNVAPTNPSNLDELLAAMGTPRRGSSAPSATPRSA